MSCIFIKRIAALLAAMSLLFIAPVVGNAEGYEADAFPSAVGDEYDPGAERLSGIIPDAFFDDYIHYASEIETLGYFSADMAGEEGELTVGQGYSPFREGLVYTHATHPTHSVLHGVDVSSYQKNIDWKAAYADGVEYAIIRVGYRGYGADGTLVADSYYQTNLDNAAAAGVKTGVYIYSQAITEEEAIEEANFVLTRLNGRALSLPVVLDFEYASVGGRNGGRLYNANLTQQQATDICLAFCRTVANAGYTPMVYANKSMLTDSLYEWQISAQYPIWLAHYTQNTSYTGPFDFWQYTSVGTVDGIPGSVDCNFWYIWIEAMDIALPSEGITVDVEDTKVIKATLTPHNASNPVTWSSSDESVAKVDANGVITGVSVGSAVITGTVGAYSDSCTVNVKWPNVKSVTLNDDKHMMERGTKYQLEATVLPKIALDTSVRWSSSNSSVASVDQNGKVTAVKEGEATITVTTNDGGLTAKCVIKVGKPVTSVTLDRSALSLYLDEKGKLTANIQPSGWIAEWSSSDENVAVVDDEGNITAVGVGKATVTASAGSRSAKATVTVLPRPVHLSMAVRLSGLSRHTYANVDLAITNKNDKQAVYDISRIIENERISLLFDLPQSTYELKVSRPGYTSYTDRSFVAGTDSLPSLITLYAGDVNGDGYVNAKDYAAHTALGAYTAAGDYDLDGKLTSADRDILVESIGGRNEVID